MEQIPGLTYFWPFTFIGAYVVIVTVLSVTYTRIRGTSSGGRLVDIAF